jgi:ribosomal protein S30
MTPTSSIKPATQSSQSKRGGQGSHGSLTKAGKVRNNTPKCDVAPRKVTKIIRGKDSAIRTEIKVRNHRKKHLGPKMANRRLARLRTPTTQGGLGREAGQWRGPNV